MKTHYDIAIIGAGPAGMAAAITASAYGAAVAVFDEQPAAGGQIYRAVSRQGLVDKRVFGPEYYQGLVQVEEFAACDAEHITGATIWQVSCEREIGVSKDGASHLLTAGQIIIATGAMERPFPVPGWTLPGVMGVGAAQVLLKSSGIVFSNAVFVGTGPLLYLVAYQYLRAGVEIRAILDTTPRANYLRALPHVPAAIANIADLKKGRRWIKELRAAGIPFIRGVQDIRCVGNETVEAVEYRKGGRWTSIETDNVLLHQGVVPNTNLSMSVGCKHVWNDAQLCWHAAVDDWYESDIGGVAIAGDSASIGGAVAACHVGDVAALGALHRGGFITKGKRDDQSCAARRVLATETRMRPFLNAMFRPPDRLRIPKDNATTVCRCEEVTARQIRDAVEEGCADTNQLKSFTRCTMGACQGRFCALTAAEIIAQETGTSVTKIAPPRQRPVVKPLLLGELENLSITSESGG